jgi:hypothetical protein
MIAEALDAYARSHARAFEGRQQTVGASDVGTCSRKVFYTKNEGDADYGVPRNPDFIDAWGARQRGATFEAAFWVPALRARYGKQLLFAGEQQETFTLGFLSGTPDGLLIALNKDVLAPLGVPDIGGDGSLIVEAKTIDPRARLDGAKPEHTYQVQVQLGLLHALTPYRPEYAVISYTDASFWDLVYEFPIRRDPTIFYAAQRRAAAILTARSPEESQTGRVDCRRPRVRALSVFPRVWRRACPHLAACDPSPGPAIHRRDRRPGARGQAPRERA